MRQTSGKTDRSALRRRILLIALGTMAWAGCMAYRLVDLHVYRAAEMRNLARKQQEQVMTLDARRGLLYDRLGRELAMSIEVDSVYAVPAEIDDPAGTAVALAPVLEIEPAGVPALKAKLTGDRMFVWVKRKVDPGARAAVEALSLKGIGFAREHKRFYPHGDIGAHVLGWVGMDNKGMDGLELQLDGKVRGQDGQVFALRDARGHRFLKVTKREPMPGNSEVLTIDQTIQHIAQRELRQAMEDTGAAAATAIVMDPSTGDILAMANEPTYNPNRPGDAPAASRKNRAIVDAYEPGSTFKVITMAAALEKGLMRPAETIDCQNGSIRVGRALIRDHKPFGLLSAAQILEYSSNVGAIKIGLRLDQDDFYETMRRFGLGARTGIELPGEARGLLREPKDWSGVSQATLSFGQEISVTPLQLVTAISAVATGGLLRPPRLLIREVAPDGSVLGEDPPREARRIISVQTASTLTQMMMGVVEEGTAKAARMPGYSIAGKTGTAQKIGPEGTYSANHFVASFAGFVPAGRPALTILVVLDEPRGSLYHGGDIAAPVFRRIALPALRYLGVPPEDGRLIEEGDEPTLVAAAHARRWVEPIPLDEAGRRAEQLRLQKQQARLASSRSDGSRPSDGDDEVAAPTRRPLPSPASVTSGDDVLLADLRGHCLRRAVSYLSRVGLKPRVDAMTSQGTPDADGEGVIVFQEPPAGSTLQRGEEVALRIGRLLPAEAKEQAQGDQAEERTEDPRRAGARVAPARRALR